MDIEARIRRRQRRTGDGSFVRDYDALNPAAHVAEPVARSPLIEQLLDHFDPVFDGALPPDAVLHGPPGSGKSAVVTALFEQLRQLNSRRGEVIHTDTRVVEPDSPAFVYLDHREIPTEFALYHGLLDRLVEEVVPDHGVSTADLERRLEERIATGHGGVVVAVDHVDETHDRPGLATLENLADRDDVAWLAVCREPLEPVDADGDTVDRDGATRVDPDGTSPVDPDGPAIVDIEIDSYQEQVLVDILLDRATNALAQRALDHTQARRFAAWADGNAHHALAALFGAADHAQAAGHNRLTEADIQSGIDAIPWPCIATGRVLALPANRQAVLRELVDLSPTERASVSAVATAVAASDRVDLSEGTVERFLYELADEGVVERVKTEGSDRQGRPPSRVEPRFATIVFRRLYDLRA